ncbi:7TM diverse intracellular signaling domain-containing protein [Algoriphagus sp. AK58]|uniref:sensor histidine kinase n=1 Tax=Algoriphagus sp. AK58 TaxID=1406877 RepID=UPI00164EEE3D|nr:7TM diverse intracellular signaling domain-containing protein [Algoriphagus sp. AK58]
MPLLISCSHEDNLGPRFSIFPDLNYTPENAWGISDTIRRDKIQFNPGITRNQWWLGMTIDNPSDSTRQFLFVPNNPHINRILVFENNSSIPSKELGDFFPFGQRPFPDRDLVIPLVIPPNSTQHYLMLLDKVGETFHIEPEVLDFQTFHQRKSIDTLVIGLFLGWMAIVFIFAIFFSTELKSWSGAIYAAYVLSISFWLATHWGLTFQYLWPEQIDWVGKARPFFNLLTNILILLLVVMFFPPKTTGKITAKLIWAIIILQVCLILSIFLTPNVLKNPDAKVNLLQFTLVVSLVSSLLVLYYPFQQWKAKVPIAGYYFVGIAFLVLYGVLIQINQKVVSIGLPHYLLDFGSAFGLMVETGIITAAFARRASLFKKEKEKLTIEILEKDKQVADQLIQVQEDERQRLGRDLHDSIGGMLASLYIKTETISDHYPAGPIEELKQLIQQSIQEARSLSHNLTPHYLEENGLENVLRLQLELVMQKYEIDFHFYFQVTSTLPKPLQLILYRISNELLQNIVKHAEATEALLSISEQEGQIELIAEDNGKGIDSSLAFSGIGLKNIRERVNYLRGSFELETNQTGTTLTIIIPLHA